MMANKKSGGDLYQCQSENSVDLELSLVSAGTLKVGVITIKAGQP